MTRTLDPIGTIRTVTSERYGTYNSVLVAHIDWMKFKDPTEFCTWTEKFHPRRYFVSYGWDRLDEDQRATVMSVYIPLEAMNREWIFQNRECLFLKEASRRPKQLPIGITTKSYRKWIEKSREHLIEFLDPEAL